MIHNLKYVKYVVHLWFFCIQTAKVFQRYIFFLVYIDAPFEFDEYKVKGPFNSIDHPLEIDWYQVHLADYREPSGWQIEPLLQNKVWKIISSNLHWMTSVKVNYYGSFSLCEFKQGLCHCVSG